MGTKTRAPKSIFIDYRGHTIWTSVAKNSKTQRWHFFTDVSWGDCTADKIQSLPSRLSYTTEEEANRAGVILGKTWIDQCKPKIN
jgi:hypothetical protein